MSFISSDGFTFIKQELLVGNNVITVYHSHNEGIIIIGYNGDFPPRMNAWYTDSKIKRLDMSFYCKYWTF